MSSVLNEKHKQRSLKLDILYYMCSGIINFSVKMDFVISARKNFTSFSMCFLHDIMSGLLMGDPRNFTIMVVIHNVVACPVTNLFAIK